MSGPTTAIFIADPITVLLSAAAIRAAQAVAEGYANAENLRDEQQGHRDRIQSELKDATSRGRAALQTEVQATETEFEQLVGLAKRYGMEDKISATRPALPSQYDDLQLAAYVRSMQALIKELRSILLTESTMRMDDVGPEALLDRAISEAAKDDRKTIVQRLLERIEHLGALPQEISSVAKEISDSPFLDTERAKLLTTELRLRIQNRVEAEQKQAVQESTALILQQMLQDLGYQVEEVSSTLFVQGGVVHFRRQGWDNYMVRMRVDPANASTNFNVIRAVESASNEKSVLDHLAEDRWCAEFPALLKALDARGLNLNVTRRLEAGELPVQLVQKNKLPTFSEEETSGQATKLNTLKIK